MAENCIKIVNNINYSDCVVSFQYIKTNDIEIVLKERLFKILFYI